jgi:hypothetical protein
VIFSQVAPLVLMRLDRFEKKFSSNSLLKILLKIQNKKKEIHNSFTCPLLEEWRWPNARGLCGQLLFV